MMDWGDKDQYYGRKAIGAWQSLAERCAGSSPAGREGGEGGRPATMMIWPLSHTQGATPKHVPHTAGTHQSRSPCWQGSQGLRSGYGGAPRQCCSDHPPRWNAPPAAAQREQGGGEGKGFEEVQGMT